MLRFQHQGYQMKALLKVDEEYQISDHLKDHYKVEIWFLSLDFRKNLEKKADLQRKEQEINGLGFFSSKWTGLKFVKFLERKVIVRISEKKSSEKTEMIVWKFENLEEMSKWTRLFQ